MHIYEGKVLYESYIALKQYLLWELRKMHYNHEMGRECPEYRTMKYLFFFFSFCYWLQISTYKWWLWNSNISWIINKLTFTIYNWVSLRFSGVLIHIIVEILMFVMLIDLNIIPFRSGLEFVILLGSLYLRYCPFWPLCRSSRFYL